MKVNDIIIDQILHVPGPAKHYDSGEDEDEGLFKKLFSKKEKEPKDTFYTSRIKEFGRDVLYDELLRGYDAYKIDKAPLDTMIILTENYLIIPEHEVFPLETLRKFALFTSWNVCTEYAQAREGCPYDPDYVSEYENEEAFELGRFEIRLILTDNFKQRYQHFIFMEVPDRKDFHQGIIDRCPRADDYTSEDVLEGGYFEDGDQDRDWL